MEVPVNVYLNHKKVDKDSFSDFKPETDAESIILNFIQSWLSGKNQFSFSTSGSSGKAKEIILTRDQLEYSAQTTIRHLQLKPGYNSLLCLNPKYIAGKMMIVRALTGKMDLYFVEPSSDPFKIIPKIRIDFSAFVPLQIRQIIADRENLNFLENMKAIIIGGASLSKNLEEEIKKLKVPVFHTFGMTETASHFALKKLNGPDRSDFFEVVGDTEIKTDTRNCLMVRSIVTNNEWLYTNDLVEIANHNRFKWLGRLDQVINSGGIKINIDELEARIEESFYKLNIDHRLVVIGVPDEKLGEKPVLVIEGEVTQISERMIENAFGSLYKYEKPKKIVFLHHFPETATGKVKRKEIIAKIHG